MDQLRGQDLKKAFSAATGCLEEYRDTVNALNVFPVPDGDTGTNMLLTMRSAVQSAAEGCPDGRDHSVATVSSALAQGAFFGARGNSGVILSQFFKGFSDALAGKEDLAAGDLALAFKLASDGAYKSVGNPVEGTMLTVIRMASEAVEGAFQGSEGDVLGLWETAYLASLDALERTPQQLPVLREAGVVDAGGLGIVVLIGGALRSLSDGGSSLVDLSALSRFQRAADSNDGRLIKPEYLAATVEQEWGFCTQFIISSVGELDLDLDRVRSHFQETARSTTIVGDGRNVRVHIHVEDPAPALSYAESLGALSEIKIENMDSQNRNFAAGAPRDQPDQPDHPDQAEGAALALALLPVAQGEGLAHLFRDSGCADVIDGGQTMNPSVQQILDAARGTGAKDVIVLPNNGNVVSAAEQAAAAEPFIHVVPTKNVPQGVAALLAFNPEGPWQENVDAMAAALSEVASLEVAKAVRGTDIGGVAVTEGQYIGLLEGLMVTAEDSPEKALRSALDRAGLNAGAIVTIYLGADTSVSDAELVAAELESGFPGIQVDLIDGGQPHHQYLASVE
ncbi:MAG: DAK2 domain-containing protein [Chloroflexi bacterium]|nr:DAK2 domain-containing protein [Chloroflexota bacterium]